MCITIYQDNSYQAKLASQDTLGIHVGYAKSYPVDTYNGYNPKTDKISLLKIVSLLHRSYGDLGNIGKPVLFPTSNEDSDEEEKGETVLAQNKNNIIISM